MSDTSDPQPERPTWHRWSSRQRQQSHERAHEEGADESIPDVPEHPMIPASDPEMIENQTALTSFIVHLRETGTFGYDSEFIGEQSYHPRLCLIQAATIDRLALIDPLADLDLTPVWELLIDPDLVKIVHAGRQDLEPPVRAMERVAEDAPVPPKLAKAPANVFDTQIAAAFAGLPYPASLAKLIEAATGINLGRGLKFSQWDARPLSLLQKRYAADDVRFLPLIHAFIIERLEACGNLAWAREECLTLSDPASYGFNVRAMRRRVRGAGTLDGRSRAILDALLEWRDEAARDWDMPPRTLLKDPVLLDLARSPVTTRQGLHTVRGLPRPVRQDLGDALVSCITRALTELDEDADFADDRPLPSPDREHVNALWDGIVQRAERLAIDPAMVTSKRELGRMLSRHAVGRTLRRTPLREGWRKQLVGDLIEPYV